MASRKKKRGASKGRKRPARKTSRAASPSIFKRAVAAPSHRKQQAPGTPFARVAPGAPPGGFTPPQNWRGWGAQRASVLGDVPQIDFDALDELARSDVFSELLRIEVDPAVAAELARVDPNAWYVVVATVQGGSASAGAPDERRATDVGTRAVFVGRGVRLWSRFLHTCDPNGGGSVLLDVEIHEVPTGSREESYPLWSGQFVRTLDGQEIEGAGDPAKWERSEYNLGARKRGRPKRGGGGMTADEKRKHNKRVKARERRDRAAREKMRGMSAVEAARYNKRRRAAIKAAQPKVKGHKTRKTRKRGKRK